MAVPVLISMTTFAAFIFILRKPNIKIVNEYNPVYQKPCDLFRNSTPKYLPPKNTIAKKIATKMK
jgi:hypothetical protein